MHESLYNHNLWHKTGSNQNWMVERPAMLQNTSHMYILLVIQVYQWAYLVFINPQQ